MPVVWPLAHKRWGEARTRGKALRWISHRGEAKPRLTSGGGAVTGVLLRQARQPETEFEASHVQPETEFEASHVQPETEF